MKDLILKGDTDLAREYIVGGKLTIADLTQTAASIWGPRWLTGRPSHIKGDKQYLTNWRATHNLSLESNLRCDKTIFSELEKLTYQLEPKLMLLVAGYAVHHGHPQLESQSSAGFLPRELDAGPDIPIECFSPPTGPALTDEDMKTVREAATPFTSRGFKEQNLRGPFDTEVPTIALRPRRSSLYPDIIANCEHTIEIDGYPRDKYLLFGTSSFPRSSVCMRNWCSFIM